MKGFVNTYYGSNRYNAQRANANRADRAKSRMPDLAREGIDILTPDHSSHKTTTSKKRNLRRRRSDGYDLHHRQKPGPNADDLNKDVVFQKDRDQTAGCFHAKRAYSASASQIYDSRIGTVFNKLC